MMAAPETIHAVLKDHEQFEELIEKLDQVGNLDELRGAVDSHGKSTADAYEYELAEMTRRELGLIRLAWEAHHQQGREDIIEIQ